MKSTPSGNSTLKFHLATAVSLPLNNYSADWQYVTHFINIDTVVTDSSFCLQTVCDRRIPEWSAFRKKRQTAIGTFHTVWESKRHKKTKQIKKEKPTNRSEHGLLVGLNQTLFQQNPLLLVIFHLSQVELTKPLFQSLTFPWTEPHSLRKTLFSNTFFIYLFLF